MPDQHHNTHIHNHCVHHEIDAHLLFVESYCQKHNLRFTSLRKEVLSIVLASKGAIGAYDILAQLKDRPKPAAPPTVYRSLDFLLEHGFIHRLASINAYIPCCHPQDAHEAAFLICKTCEKVTEYSKKPLFSELSELMEQQSFSAHKTIVEIMGTCSDCS